jgi:hypothetical protein
LGRAPKLRKGSVYTLVLLGNATFQLTTHVTLQNRITCGVSLLHLTQGFEYRLGMSGFKESVGFEGYKRDACVSSLQINALVPFLVESFPNTMNMFN